MSYKQGENYGRGHGGSGNGGRGSRSGGGHHPSEHRHAGGGRFYHDEMPGYYRNGTGASTFRRGKLLNFLERLYVRKATLKKQLEQEEYQSMQETLKGELKALETVINELIQEFDLNELTDDLE